MDTDKAERAPRKLRAMQVNTRNIEKLVGRVISLLNDRTRRENVSLADLAQCARNLEKMRVDMMISELAMKRMGERVARAIPVASDMSLKGKEREVARRKTDGDNEVRGRTYTLPGDIFDRANAVDEKCAEAAATIHSKLPEDDERGDDAAPTHSP